jgi:anti-sigma regulatory factor (Ser/Thr protein kinase)
MSSLDHMELELPSVEYHEVPRARAAARGWCSTAGVSRVTDAVLLVLTELLGNAVCHARTPVTVRLEARPTVIRIEVCDGSPDRPTRRAAGSGESDGRGLAIVDAITARHWGSECLEHGKLVWAEIARQ